MTTIQQATVDDLDPGDVVCLVTDSDGVEVVQWATPAVLAATGRHHGVASQAASKGGAANIITGGTVRKLVHGLTALSSRVRVTSGRLEAVSAYVDGDYPAGFLNARGDLFYEPHDVIGSGTLDAFLDTTQPAAIPGATGTYTESTATYPSSIDSSITDLFLKYCYDIGLGAGGGLPVFVLMHSYPNDANEVTQTVMRRFAGYGFLAVSVGMRGRNSAGGAADSSGREPHDVLDALTKIRALLPAVASSTVAAVSGWSGGGGTTYALAAKSPDSFNVFAPFFGITDYGYDTVDGWYYTTGHRPQLVTEVGVDRDADRKPYRARDHVESIAKSLAGGGYLYMLHDAADLDVTVANARRVRDAMVAAELSNFTLDESSAQSAIRWTHGLPADYPQLIQGEWRYARRARGAAAWTVPTRGRLRVTGWVKTKRFEIWLGPDAPPRTSLTGGKSEVAEVEYDTLSATYFVTPLTNPTMQVQIIQGTRNVVKEISGPTEIELNAPDTVTISSPHGLSNCVLDLAADAGVTLVGSDVSVWTDQSTGGHNYTEAANRPAFEASFEGAAAVRFDAANSERMGGPVVIDPNAEYTLAFVYRAEDTNIAWSQCSSAAFNKDWSYFSSGGSYAIHSIADDLGNNAGAGSGGDWSGAWHVYVARRTGSLVRIQVDGNLQATVPTPAGSVVGTNRSALGCLWDSPGQRAFALGRFRAVAAYSRSLTDNECGTLRTFWKSKWPGLP